MRCDGCTACCTYLDIPWMDSPIGETCSKCDGSKCTIWKMIPSKCKSYACAYRQNTQAPIELRPDKCGVIFELLPKGIMFGLMFKEEIPDIVLEQIKQFNKQGYSVVIDVMHDKKLFFMPKDGETQKELKAKFNSHKEQVKEWQPQLMQQI